MRITVRRVVVLLPIGALALILVYVIDRHHALFSDLEVDNPIVSSSGPNKEGVNEYSVSKTSNIVIAPENKSGQPGTAANSAMLENRIVEFLGSEAHPSWATYENSMATLNPESVPILARMLSDDAFRNRWAEISHIIAWVCNKEDRTALDAILAYIRRPDSWIAAGIEQPGAHVLGKAKALGYLGLLKVDEVPEILRQAFTVEGAQDLIQAWISLPQPKGYDDPRVLVNDIRRYAARGLVLTRSPENVALVRDCFERFAHRTMSDEYKEKGRTEDTEYETEDYYLLVGALSENDMIEAMGLEEFLRIEDTDFGIESKDKYTNKYWGVWRDDEVVIVEPCPICGKSSTQL